MGFDIILIVWPHYIGSSVRLTPIKTQSGRMKLKTLLAIALVAMVFTSCNRYISTYEAANGKAKCGRSLR
jgi:hypothetical protein